MQYLFEYEIIFISGLYHLTKSSQIKSLIFGKKKERERVINKIQNVK